MPTEEATTPKSSSKKRAAPVSVTSVNFDTRFAWACFKSTDQAINHDELARLCKCTKNAAQLRFYKMRNTFQDVDLFADLGMPDDNASTPTPAPSKKRRQKKDSTNESTNEAPNTPTKQSRVKKVSTEEEAEDNKDELESQDKA